MPSSITQENYIKNLVTSLMDYTKENVGTSITVRGTAYTITYDYSFPRETTDLEAIVPCLIFEHIATSQDVDYGMGNFKMYHSSIRIWGYANSGSTNDWILDEQIRANLMSKIMAQLSDKYAIPFKEGTSTVGRLKTKCEVRKLEVVSTNILDRFRFVADVIVQLPYSRV